MQKSFTSGIADMQFSVEETGLLLKSLSDDAKEDENSYKMFGFASTPAKDRESETILQKGLNLKPYNEDGWVNFDHDRLKLIGYPTVGDFRTHPKIKTLGFYTEFQLLKGHPVAQVVWETALALRKNNAPRTFHLSVEGRRREVSDTGQILAADIHGIAVTPYGVNNTTSANVLSKGILGDTSVPQFEAFALPSDKGVSEALQELSCTLKKALTTGNDVGGVTQEGGASLRVEDMSAKVSHLVDFDVERFEPFYTSRLLERSRRLFKSITEKASERGGKVTKGEAVLVFSAFGFPFESILEQLDL